MDLRGFIELLSAQGRLKRITRSVDWRCELGEITRNHQVPLLFENIRDYPGQCVFTNGLYSFESIGLALGLGPGKSKQAIIAEAKKRVSNPIKPILVEAGPVLENIVPPSEIDFLRFPVPQWSEEDGGRYLGTWHINVTRDPDTASRNLGVYRMQVLDRNHATVSASQNSDIAIHVAKAERKGKPLEMAVAMGVSEAVVMAAGAAYPSGLDEYGLAGGLQAEPVNLVKCRDVDLEVPADSEIVIEGVLKLTERVPDGPYFDYAGEANTNPNAFVFEATSMMFRTNPIFRGSAIGKPGAEDHQLFMLLSALHLLDFHGSRARRMVQAPLIKLGLFRAFQFAGRISPKMFRSPK